MADHLDCPILENKCNLFNYHWSDCEWTFIRKKAALLLYLSLLFLEPALNIMGEISTDINFDLNLAVEQRTRLSRPHWTIRAALNTNGMTGIHYGLSGISVSCWEFWCHTHVVVLKRTSVITRGREITSLGFASVSLWGRDQVIIEFFPVIWGVPLNLH